MSDEDESKTHFGDLKSRFTWKKVHGPRIWRPKVPGEELVGYYGGKTLRNGAYGQYEVVVVHVPIKGTYLISGIQVVQLVDASSIDVRWPIRIVWRGTEALDEERTLKKFEVFVAEGDPIAEEDVPEVQEPQIRIGETPKR